MIIEFTREEKMALCKKSNQNRKEGKQPLEGFTRMEKLGLAMWQVEVLNQDSRLSSVRESWEKWNKMAKMLILEILKDEVKEIPTNKGMKKVLRINNSNACLCFKCNGSGINHTSHSNICKNCGGRGWYYIKSIKILNIEEFDKIVRKKYLEDCKKNREISYLQWKGQEEWEKLDTMKIAKWVKL